MRIPPPTAPGPGQRTGPNLPSGRTRNHARPCPAPAPVAPQDRGRGEGSRRPPASGGPRADPLDEDARGVTGVGGDDELARPWCAALVRVGVPQEPVARLERGAHALADHDHARLPRTADTSRTRDQGDDDGAGGETGPAGGPKAAQEGRPPFLSQKT